MASNWTGTWGMNNPYDVHFCYGDGGCAAWSINTNLATRNWSHTFYPCYTTQFAQTLYVQEESGVDGLVTSRATESGGSPC